MSEAGEVRTSRSARKTPEPPERAKEDLEPETERAAQQRLGGPAAPDAAEEKGETEAGARLSERTQP